MKKIKTLKADDNISVDKVSGKLFDDIRQLIESAKNNVARTVNASMALLYWHIGSRIRKDILGHERAPYGEQIVLTLSRLLSWSFKLEPVTLMRNKD